MNEAGVNEARMKEAGTIEAVVEAPIAVKSRKQ